MHNDYAADWDKSVVFTPALGLRGVVAIDPQDGELRATFSNGGVTVATIVRRSKGSKLAVLIPGETMRDKENMMTGYRSMKQAMVALDRRYAKIRKRNLRAALEAMDFDSRSSIIENVPGMVGIVAKAVERRMAYALVNRTAQLAGLSRPKPLPPGRYDATYDYKIDASGCPRLHNFKILGPSA